MANEPPAEQLLRPELLLATETPSWQLVCQLSEEVGFLRGTLLGLQFADVECIDNLVVTALKQHDQLSAIRRTFSVTAEDKR